MEKLDKVLAMCVLLLPLSLQYELKRKVACKQLFYLALNCGHLLFSVQVLSCEEHRHNDSQVGKTRILAIMIVQCYQ